MDEVELRLQRVLDRAELVVGIGDQNLGTMCIMSFVAGLAGEGRTDAPRCASPLITAFAVPVNDRMPHGVRQRLKPFAPRILGTADGLDRIRAVVLRQALEAELLPKLHPYPQPAMLWHRVWGGVRSGRVWCTLRRDMLRRRIRRLLARTNATPQPSAEVVLARATGRLLGLCAGAARDAREAEGYWNAAIGLLDRLCDVGTSERKAAPMEGRLVLLEATLPPRR